MQDKNKKNILKIFAFIATSLTIVSMCLSVVSLDYSNILEKNGYQKPDLYWRMDSSFLFFHYSVYDYRDQNNSSEYHRYNLFYFFIFETGDKSISDSFSHVNFYDGISVDKEIFFTDSATSITWLLFAFVILLLCIFFCYRGIKYCTIKKTKDFLFLGIIGLIFSFVFIVLRYFAYDFVDINELGYTKYFNFEYGFYVFYVSIFLFFVVYFIQKYFLDLPDETDVIRN